VYFGACGTTGTSAPGTGVAAGAPELISGIPLSAAGAGGGGAIGPPGATEGVEIA